MDVSRFKCNFGRLSLLACLLSVGCAESSGYIDYSTLPQPVTETTTTLVETETTEAETESTTTEEAAVEVTSAGEDVANNVKPVEADYDKGVQGDDKADTSREIKLLIPNKTFPAIKDSDAIRVGYDDIDLEKILNIVRAPNNVVDHFPDWLKQLDGKKIRMRGFMYPTFKAEGLGRFVFTRDTGACCFGPDPYIFLRASVKLSEGEKTDYIHMQPFDVEGTFRIAPLSDDDGLWQLYAIEDARVL